MKIIIVASSPVKTFKETYHRNPSDYFIGIDGGSLELIARNIKPDVSIGDFDSTKDLQLIKENSYDTLFFPKQKEDKYSGSKASRIQAGLSHGLILIQSSVSGGSKYTLEKYAKLLIMF